MPYLSTMKYRDALWIFKLRKEKVSKMTMKRQKTLHRFAAVAAVLLALCLVFMMPAAAEGGTECTGCNTNTVHTHVAQVGEGESAKYYATLQAAVNVAGAEDTIVLINDVTLTGTLTISADEEITLDLNGKNRTRTASNRMTMQINSNGLSKRNRL